MHIIYVRVVYIGVLFCLYTFRYRFNVYYYGMPLVMRYVIILDLFTVIVYFNIIGNFTQFSVVSNVISIFNV